MLRKVWSPDNDCQREGRRGQVGDGAHAECAREQQQAADHGRGVQAAVREPVVSVCRVEDRFDLNDAKWPQVGGVVRRRPEGVHERRRALRGQHLLERVEHLHRHAQQVVRQCGGAGEGEHVRPGPDAERADALDDVVSGFSRTRQAGTPGLRRIRAAPETPADAKDVDKRQRSASEGDTTLLVPVPRHADFADRQTRPIGEREHLHVEREAVDRQVRTDRLHRVSAEQLEAALRVADAADDEGADEPVEEAPDEVTDPGLVEALGARRLPGSDDQRRAPVTGVLEKAGKIVGRRRQVGVGHEAPLAAGLEQPAV